MAQDNDDDIIFGDSSTDFVIISSFSATGALLGLSTLSFLDEPWDHKKNILVGLSFGIIIGVGLVAYRHANRSGEYYEEVEGDGEGGSAFLRPAKDFDTYSRVSWHMENFFSHQEHSYDVVPFWMSSF